MDTPTQTLNPTRVIEQGSTPIFDELMKAHPELASDWDSWVSTNTRDLAAAAA